MTCLCYLDTHLKKLFKLFLDTTKIFSESFKKISHRSGRKSSKPSWLHVLACKALLKYNYCIDILNYYICYYQFQIYMRIMLLARMTYFRAARLRLVIRRG